METTVRRQLLPGDCEKGTVRGNAARLGPSVHAVPRQDAGPGRAGGVAVPRPSRACGAHGRSASAPRRTSLSAGHGFGGELLSDEVDPERDAEADRVVVEVVVRGVDVVDGAVRCGAVAQEDEGAGSGLEHEGEVLSAGDRR